MLHLGVYEPKLHRKAPVVMVGSGGSVMAIVRTGNRGIDGKVIMQVGRYVSSDTSGATIATVEVSGRQDLHMAL